MPIYDEELTLLRRLLDLISQAKPVLRSKVVKTLVTLLQDDGLVPGSLKSHRVLSDDLKGASRELVLPRFGEDRSISVKEFVRDKQPKSDVERVACLGYYLTHYRSQQRFKTADLSALNQEAGLPKIGNATQATDNATKSGFLIAAGAGQKQISAFGEQFVQALPDRDEAKKAASVPLRRGRKRKARK